MGGLQGVPPLGGVGIPSPSPIEIGVAGGAADAGTVNAALQEIETWVGDISAWDQSYGNALVGGLVDELKTIFAVVWTWVKSLAQTWLGQLIQSVWDWLKNLYEQLKKYIEEVEKWLKWYESLVRYYEQKIFGPLLQVISALRRVLLIFRIFHLKFAQELDQYLAGREAALAQIFLFNQREFNTLINWLNYIINPFGLVNEGLYLQSALQSIGALYAALWGVPVTQLGATTQQQQLDLSGWFQANQAKHNIVIEAASGLLPIDQQNFAEAQQALLDAGYAQ